MALHSTIVNAFKPLANVFKPVALALAFSAPLALAPAAALAVPALSTMATHAQPDSSTFQAKQVSDERFAHLPTPSDVVEGQHGHGSLAWQPSTSALRPAFRRCAAA